MTDYIKVDIQTLSEAIINLDNEIEKAVNNLKVMNDEILSLNATWQGDAKESFMNQYKEDYQTMLDAIAGMREIKADMEYAKDAYSKCEVNVDTLISDIV